MRDRKIEKSEENDGMSGANHDSEIGCSDRQDGLGIRLRDVELSSLLNVENQLSSNWG
jgi:hypothetical protein